MIAWRWYRNINLFSIAYAFRPQLRTRLTLGGLTCPRKPWAYGEQDSHLLYRYSYRHSHFHAVQVSLPSPFSQHGTLPYRMQQGHSLHACGFGAVLESR